MRAKYFKVVGLGAAVAAFASVCIVGIHAGPTKNTSSACLVTTNWIGCLVAGKEDTVDRIAPGPHPITVRQVEIGLRSDGVVVWRSTSEVR